MAEAILGIGFLVFAAHFFTALFERKRIPDVLLLTLLGVLLGPVLHLVTPESFGRVGHVMSTLALIVILFESGITLDPTVLLRTLRPTASIALTTFAITGAAAFAAAVFVLKLDPYMGGIAAAVLAPVSASVVIPLVRGMRMKEPLSTILVMEAALGDVLAIVLLLGLLETSGASGPHVGKMVGTVFASLVCAGAIGVLGGLAWLLVLQRVQQFPNTSFTTLAYCFILYGLSDILGFSGGIAALAFGFTLTNCRLMPLTSWKIFHGRELGSIRPSDMSFYMEVLFLLKTFFFLYLGVSIHFEDPWLLLYALGFTVAVYLARHILVRITLTSEKAGWQNYALASILVPKGLVSAVLASIPVERGIAGAEILRSFTYMAVLVSIVVTAVMIPLSSKAPLSSIYRWVFGKEESVQSETPVATH